MIIPYEKLAPEVLDGVLQDVASREGTDYGAQEASLDQKIVQLRAALRGKQCFLVYDEIAESIGVISREEAVRLSLR